MKLEELINLGIQYHPSDDDDIVIGHKRAFDSTKSEVRDKYLNLDITDSEFYSYLMLVGFGSNLIQKPLRNKIKPDDFIQKIITNLDSFLLKTGRIQSEVLFRQDNYSDQDSFYKGQDVSFDNFFVTSIDDFDNSNIVWVITPLKENSRGHSGYLVYDHNNEKQVTFERNSTFRIDRIDGKYIYCTES